jgi:hypothetical protein
MDSTPVSWFIELFRATKDSKLLASRSLKKFAFSANGPSMFLVLSWIDDRELGPARLKVRSVGANMVSVEIRCGESSIAGSFSASDLPLATVLNVINCVAAGDLLAAADLLYPPLLESE